VLAEQALRKLMAARFAGKEAHRKGTPGAVEAKSEAQGKNEMIWEETMRAVLEADEEERRRHEEEDWEGDAGGGDLPMVNGDIRAKVERHSVPAFDEGMSVNYERRYWRQAARVKQ
jgi:hypothetical protein